MSATSSASSPDSSAGGGSALFSRSARRAESASVAPLRAGIDGEAAHLLRRRDRVGVDRDEEVGLRRAGDPDPLAERNEDVVVAGHHDPVATFGLERLRQLLGEAEHDFLLGDPPGAAAPGSMPPWPGIEDDDRPLVALALRHGGDRRARRPARSRRPPCGRRPGRPAVNSTTSRAASPGGRIHLDRGDDRRLGEVDHHPRAPGREQAVTEGAKSAPSRPGRSRSAGER